MTENQTFHYAKLMITAHCVQHVSAVNDRTAQVAAGEKKNVDAVGCKCVEMAGVLSVLFG